MQIFRKILRDTWVKIKQWFKGILTVIAAVATVFSDFIQQNFISLVVYIRPYLERNYIVTGVVCIILVLVLYLVSSNRKNSKKISQAAESDKETKLVLLTMMEHTKQISELSKAIENINENMGKLLKMSNNTEKSNKSEKIKE